MNIKDNRAKYIMIIVLLALTLIVTILTALLIDSEYKLRDSAALQNKNASNIERLEHLVDESQRRCDALITANEELKKSNNDLKHLNDSLVDTLKVYEHNLTVKSPTPPRYLDVPLDEELQSYIWSLCCAYNIDEHYVLVYAIIKKESDFKPDVISATNDHGLMQINVSNHSSLSSMLGVVDFLDPYQNVHAGIYMIAKLIHKYGVDKALMAYNLGETCASALWRSGVYSTGYTKAVLDIYMQIK